VRPRACSHRLTYRFVHRPALLCAWLALALGCEPSSRDPAVKREPAEATDPVPLACPPSCTGSGCNGCDAKAEHCDSRIVNGEFGVKRWPDRDIGPNRVDATIHKTAACGGVKWPFATTNYVCDTFSTWLADEHGQELPHTRYDSRTKVIQIYGNMWSGAVRACASVCSQTVCSEIDR
jgi:hypothetical protein